MKLKGIELKGSYKLEFYDEYFEVYNDKGHKFYSENDNGYWHKSEFDENGNQIYHVDSNGHWVKKEYDERNKQIYYENDNGYWSKSDFDERGNLIYFEDSEGEVLDERVKELTIEEIEKLLGYKIKIKGERKYDIKI